jgi:MoaA/NifB/PqqE/SkfB family radical SAM enzyme
MFGEPLLHPQIVEMAKYIKTSNINHSVLLTTNGYFLNEIKAKGLIEAGADKIVVSFFSLRTDRLNTLTGNGNIDGVIDNIKNAVKLKKDLKSKTKLFIRYLMCEENEDELKDFRNLAEDIGISLEVRKTHNYSGVIENNYVSKTFFKGRYPCYHLWFSPAISWDGKVLLCCSDWDYFEVLGDIHKESLASIWQGDRIRQLRRFHLKGMYDKIPLCEKCNVGTLYPDIFFGFQKR